MSKSLSLSLPAATSSSAGIMTADQVEALNGAVSAIAAKGTEIEALTTELNTAKTNIADARTELTAASAAIESNRKNADAKMQLIENGVDEHTAQIGQVWSELQTLHTLTLENTYAYGVEWDITNGSGVCTRIGNLELHRTLPVQSAMKGCLMDDNGNIVEWLPETDWTTADRSGAKGQVMVRIPRHYRRFVKDGNKRQVWFSEKPLPGYHESPEFFVSAYEATIQRSTGKLCSVMNADPDYRGGVNDASVDADPVKTKLGKCADGLTLLQYREAATLRNPTSKRWCQYIYEAHKTLVWMFVVEYATINARKDFVAELTADGYRQGGITKTNSNLTSALLKENFNGGAVSTIGWTDEFGNGSGAKRFDAGTFYTTTLRYRGIENFTSHMHKWLDGLNTSHNEWVCVSNNPAIFSSENSDGYRKAWALPPSEKEGYPKDVMMGEFGDIFPVDVTGTLTTHWACYTSSYGPGWSTIKPVGSCYVAGAPYVNNYYNLLTIDYGAYFPNSTKYAAHNGARLCYIPESAN